MNILSCYFGVCLKKYILYNNTVFGRNLAIKPHILQTKYPQYLATQLLNLGIISSKIIHKKKSYIFELINIWDCTFPSLPWVKMFILIRAEQIIFNKSFTLQKQFLSLLLESLKAGYKTVKIHSKSALIFLSCCCYFLIQWTNHELSSKNSNTKIMTVVESADTLADLETENTVAYCDCIAA